MANYFLRDLQATDDGDLVIENGALVVAGVAQSQRQLIVNILSTSRGDYPGDPNVGWGNERFAGRPNTPETHKAMERDLAIALASHPDVSPVDLDFVVAPVDEQTVSIVLIHRGNFYEPDGKLATDPVILSWRFALQTGKLEILER